MNLSTATARVLVDELVRCGLTEVVVCPGSRSAPLAYAVHEAERAGRLRAHVRVDERSAGFLALGLGKLTRRPAAVVTTSGTAVANLHPAVLEAHHAQVPLVVVSADRPVELRGTGANQTTVQPGIFAGALRWQADLPAAWGTPGEAAGWRTAVDRAWAAATGGGHGFGAGDCGPVHLNVGFRDPLAPDLEPEAPGPALGGRADGLPWTATRAGSSSNGHSSGPVLAAGFPGSQAGGSSEDRTLMVLGDLPDAAMAGPALRLAALRGWPVLAEPFGSGDRTGVLPHGSLLLAASDWVHEHLPERVLVVGRVTLSRDVAGLLRDPSVRVEVVSPTSQWSDPGHVAAVVHPWQALLAALVEAECGVVAPDGGPTGQAANGWSASWFEAGRRLLVAVRPHLRASWPSGVAVARAVLDGLDQGDRLVLGSSNPARDVDLAMRPDDRVDVVAGRGLAGIDGTVSTAVGVALADSGRYAGGRPARRTVALMGDLTFLHDANGLLIGPGEPVPNLTVVVVNDDGGGIFRVLEYGEPERAAAFGRFFATPTGTDLAALCRAHGIPHADAESAEALTAAVREPVAGMRVVEVRVPADGHRAARAGLRSVAAATAAAG